MSGLSGHLQKLLSTLQRMSLYVVATTTNTAGVKPLLFTLLLLNRC